MKRVVGAASFIVLLVGCVIGALMVFDRLTMERDSLEARVQLLEEKVQRDAIPRIYVQNASIWNTDGEIIVETYDKNTNKNKGEEER